MGILYDMQAFYRWLESAPDHELIDKRKGLLDLLTTLSQDEVICETNRLLKIIESELLARRVRP